MASRFSEHVYTLTRFIFGLLFACHGAQKLFGALGGHQMTGNPKMLAAGVIEFVGGILIALGIAASVAAFIACGEMAFAYFTVHAPRGFWPIQNMGEPAVLYCFFFLWVAARGSGRFSVDAVVRRR
jgi:putative oxidoreductase